MTSAADLLLQTAGRGELHHAVILHGPHAHALRALALRTAKALNCVNGTSGDGCSACGRIDRGMHPDVHMISVEADRKLISIEQIRTAVGEATLRPYEGRTKVFIIEPADAVSGSGLNALLKTLEEPAADTVFLLLTRSPDLLLPTIRSRSQSIYAADASAGAAALGSLQAARLQEIAGFASASDRDELVEVIVDSLHRLATRGETAALLSLAARLAQTDSDSEALALLALVLSDGAALDPAETIDPEKFADIRDALSSHALLAAADRAISATRWLTNNADVRMLLEHALVPLTKKDPAF